MLKSILAFARFFLILSVISGGAAFALYFGLRGLLNRSPIVFAYLRGIPYYDQYPAPFLISLSVLFGITGSVWLMFVAPRARHFQPAQIGVLPILTVFLAGAIWGAIGIYYDMKAGFFPPLAIMMDYLVWGARQGLRTAPIAAFLSFPINLMSYTIACALLVALKRSSEFQSEVRDHEKGG